VIAGRPATAKTPKNVERVRINENCCLTVRELEDLGNPKIIFSEILIQYGDELRSCKIRSTIT